MDWSSRNLYYFDMNKRVIGVLSIDGKYHKTLINLPDYYPSAMTIDLQNK